MTSPFDVFKENGTPQATIVDLPWPVDEPKMTFQVHRFADAEMEAATLQARARLHAEGVYAPGNDATEEERRAFRNLVLTVAQVCQADIIRRHVKGWTYLADVPEPWTPAEFNDANLAKLFASFGEIAKLQFAGQYIEAVDAETKKKEPPATTDAAS